MGEQSKWVKLPKDAQVTMSRESWEATRGMGPGGKVMVVLMIIAVAWLIGHATDMDEKAPAPRPQTSTSAPAHN